MERGKGDLKVKGNKKGKGEEMELAASVVQRREYAKENAASWPRSFLCYVVTSTCSILRMVK